MGGCTLGRLASEGCCHDCGKVWTVLFLLRVGMQVFKCLRDDEKKADGEWLPNMRVRGVCAEGVDLAVLQARE